MTCLGGIIKIIKGKNAQNVTGENKPGFFRYIQIEDLRSNESLKFTDDKNGVHANLNDVLIAWDGANAGTVGFNLEGIVGSTIAILRPIKKTNSSFLGYFLKSQLKNIQENCTGATIPHINRQYLENIDFPDINITEQQRIAGILKKADRIRQLRRTARELSNQYLQSVFLEMFFSKEKNHWKTVTVENCIKKKKNSIRTGPFGSQLLHSEFVTKGIPVLGIDNVVNNYFEWGKMRYISNEKFDLLKRYRVYPRDILISIMGTNGRCVIIPDNIPLSINSKHLCCLTLNEEICFPEFFQINFLKNPGILQQLGVSQRGAVMPGLNMEIIKNLSFKLPPYDLQEKFKYIFDNFNEFNKKQKEAERQSEQLFQTLLNQAFNGEL